MRSPLILILSLIIAPALIAQDNYTISGTITDKETGEALIGANIYVSSLNSGTTTNAYGYYSLTLPAADSIMLAISHVGYHPQVKKINLNANLKLNSGLSPGEITLEEVVVQDVTPNFNVERSQISVVDLPIRNIAEIPVLLGETDILKLIQLMPGVQGGNEGTTGFHVRGGNSDQNLVQLDEATVYNPNHLLGFFSTFNSRMLKNATLIKGGFPAQYGGRLSSVLDLTMKEGNNRKFQGEGGLGFITTSLVLEGPIVKDRASFIVSGRRTYIDLLVKPFLPKGNQSRYDFHDINAKLNWKISEKDRLFLSFFKGRDHARLKSGEGINYRIRFGNTTGTLRWNHIFGPKLFVNNSLIFNKYDQDISAIQDNFFSQTITRLEDINTKTEFQYFPNHRHSVRFGAHFIHHQFVSGGKSEAESALLQNINRQHIPSKELNEFALYVNDEFKLSERILINTGIRVPGFSSREVNYLRVEPRASVRVITGQQSSIKAAYTQMNQYLHQIPSSTASVPTDVWIPSTDRTRPQRSFQYALGYFKNVQSKGLELSLEGYYKDMKNQVLFPEGNQLVEDFAVDTALVYGKGWSYGTELYLRKNSGPLTGWLSYTLSWTWQQFDDLNFGWKFPFRYDRRHAVNVVGSYQLNQRWSVSAAFVYNTGIAYTLPEGRFPSNLGPTLFEGNYYVYTNRNNQRLGAYNRLDLSAIRRKEGRLFGQKVLIEWVFGIYNVYSRQNPYFVYLQVNPVTDRPEAVQVTLLPIIPSISYNLKF